MAGSVPSFFVRLFLCWAAFFRTLFDGQFAAGVVQLRRGQLPEPRELERAKPKHAEPPERTPEPSPARGEPAASPKPVVLREATPDAACQLLSVLQREGRFLDFVMEELGQAADADIGAAARVVHEGCRRALREHFEIEVIRSEEEGTQVTLESGFDAARVRITGNVRGQPPFSGTLSHRGWCCASVQLPKMSEEHDASILAPAEVEL